MIVGVDFDTYKATMVGLPLEGGGRPVLEVVTFRKKAGDDEAVAALTRARSLLLTSSLLFQGEVFFVERGWGASRKADYMMGAYFGVIFSFLSGYGPTNVMNAQEWKKAISACCGVRKKDGSAGRGDLKKEDAHVYVRLVADLFSHDVSAYGPDALDAYAIATTGKWLNDAASVKMGGMLDERYISTSGEDAVPGGSAGGMAVLDHQRGS